MYMYITMAGMPFPKKKKKEEEKKADLTTVLHIREVLFSNRKQ